MKSVPVSLDGKTETKFFFTLKTETKLVAYGDFCFTPWDM